MNKTCGHPDIPPGGELIPGAVCGVCWIWANRSDLREAVERGPVESPPPAYPSLAEQAANLVDEVERWKAAGRPLVDAATLERRQATCRACPKYDPERDRCQACGCGVEDVPLLGKLAGWLLTGESVPPKLHMSTASCPEGRWLPVVS